MKLQISLIVCLTAFLFAQASADKKDQCSVCRALVLEAEERIQEVDPKETIQAGSYRVDPDGNQKLTEIQYARSNTHLEEVVESLCGKMHNYADRLLEDRSKHLVRVKGYSEEYNDELKLDHGKGKVLKYQCDVFLDDHEEEIISYLQKDDVEDYERYICLDKTGVCTEEQLQVKLDTVERPKEKHDVEVEEPEDEEENEEEDEEEEHDEL